MSLFDELRNLEQLHQHGELSRQEFERAKRELLESPPTEDASCDTLTLEEALAQDQERVQDELDRIDREWEIQSRPLLITSRSGQTYAPTKAGALLQMAAGVAFGVCWIIVDCWVILKRGPGEVGVSVFTFLGPLIVLFSIAQGYYFLVKARRYQQADAAYRQRRAAAIERNWQK